jgi:nitrogen-specific signal transduction histidine kinase/CheY-like chemotaxis protein
VSEKRKVEAELRQAQKMEALGQLTSGIAHDFNNILASILGFSELSLIELQAGRTEKLEARLKEINIAGRRGKALIEQMLRFTRRDSHEQQRLQLEPLLQEIVRLARSTLPSSILIQPVLQNEGLSIIADPVQIHQAMMNLCVNARDAMDSKGVLGIRLQWKRNFEFECSGCRCKASGDWVVITVEDNGPGIPANIREQVFEPFFTTKAPGKGTGMGLAVVQSVVHQNHGHILMESSEGHGTRFHLLFPPAQESDNGPEWQPEREEAPDLLSGNVLVVDDEPAVLSVTCALLDHEGLHAIPFHDAGEALAHFCKDPDAFDLAVVDQTMPRMTGVELIKQLHKTRPTLPVILCTGFSDSVNEKNATNYGITAFLHKPVELRTLRHALLTTLKR